jgi:hypothetical protein
MASGPEHYREAEELLALAADYEKDCAPHSAARCRTEAQVRAILAQAAATAMLAELFATHADISHSHVDSWDDVTAAFAAATDEPTTADVFSASELHEMDQADEAALDAMAEAEFAQDAEGQL